MKIVGWILFVLSIVILPLLAITGVTGIFEDPLWLLITIGVIAFLVLGFISHIIIAKVGSREEKDSFALYILTAPAFYILYIILHIAFFWLAFIDWLFYIGCGKHYISDAIKWFKSIITPYKTDYDEEQERKREEEKNKVEVFVVMDGNYKRELKYLPQRGSTMDYNSESPYNGMRYKMYIDDIGNYWRSYDDGKTFIKEIGYKHDIV